MNTTNPLFETIQKTIDDHGVVLFMKGTPEMPLCGFSNFVVQVLQRLKMDFVGVNILESEELRQAIKDFSDWPTVPQLYIKGEFVGGSDIVRDMLQNGELIAFLEEKMVPFSTQNMKAS